MSLEAVSVAVGGEEKRRKKGREREREEEEEEEWRTTLNKERKIYVSDSDTLVNKD